MDAQQVKERVIRAIILVAVFAISTFICDLIFRGVFFALETVPAALLAGAAYFFIEPWISQQFD